MIEQDTIRLLRECDAGVKMGAASIDNVLEYVSDKKFKAYLATCKSDHEKLEKEIRRLLHEYHDEGKEPALMAKGMSWIKTNVKLTVDESDNTVAELITDGCNMGVKDLNRYLNEYEAVDEKSKDIAKKLANIEEKLATDIRQFL